MITTLSFIAGAAVAVAARAALPRALLFKFRRDVRCLNAGDYGPLLAGYADDAVLHFNEGAHRWSGAHRGKAAIERFMRDFTAAGLQAEVHAVLTAGPPWALVIVARLDDWATGPDGEKLYANRVVVVAHTRWGKIVEHEDFYMDTARIVAFEEKLRQLGVAPAGAVPAASR